MAITDDFRNALAAEDTAIDQAIAYIEGEPARLQAAFNAGAAQDNAALAELQADVTRHGAALVAVLPTATPATPAVPVANQ